MKNQAQIAFCSNHEFAFLCKIRGTEILLCKTCGYIISSPQPSWFYSNFSLDINKEISEYKKIYLPAREISNNKYWEIITSFKKTNRILEIGCGWGFYLQAAKNRGWDCAGIEINIEQAEWAKSEFNLIIYDNMNDTDIKKKSIDVIALWDVIEHIPDTNKVISEISLLIRDGGLLILRTPNANALHPIIPWWKNILLNIYKIFLYPANPSQHYHHFTPSVLVNILTKNDFEIINIDEKCFPGEWVVNGSNKFIRFARKIIMYFAWASSFPYEFVILAKYNSKEHHIY